MAYEDITYEVILQRMLDKVPDNMDKREGSIIYDALAPAAVELQLMYIELDTILKETFADTAQRDYLVRRVAERGIEPYNATYAKLKGIEENFKAADGTTTIKLDSVPNLWVFNGKVLEKSANDYSVDDVINWNLVLTQMFAYGKTGE